MSGYTCQNINKNLISNNRENKVINNMSIKHSQNPKFKKN